jgi:DNA-binding NarL/FixJ family response regulator
MRKTERSIKKGIQVVIADAHEMYGQILALTLEEAGMQVIQRVMTGRQAVEATLKHKPDIVLMDVVMPDMDGLAALSVIKYSCPEVPVFMITSLEDPLYLARAGELGAEGFFSKSVRGQELVMAIQEVIAKGAKMGNRRKSHAQPLPAFGNQRHEESSILPKDKELTEKEVMILSLIAKGLDNQSMIERLHITKNTLKTHVRSIFAKLKVTDRTQAAIWAIHHGYGDGLFVEGKVQL